MTERGVPAEGNGLAASLEARGETVVYVAIDGALRLALGVADRPRPVAADVVRLLRGHGVTHVALLTGDTAASAESARPRHRRDRRARPRCPPRNSRR